MSTIQLRDFLQYRFLNATKASPDGNRAAFTVTSCDEENNSYRHDVWLWDGATARPLTNNGKSDAFLWEDDEHLLIPSVVKGSTLWKRLTLSDGSLEDAFTLPFFVKSMEKLDAARWFFTARDKLPPTPGCSVVECLPVRFNGLGYTSPSINSLYLYDTTSGQLTKLSPEGFHVTHATRFGKCIAYSGAAKEKLGVKFDDIRIADPNAGTDRAVYERKDLAILDLYEVENRLMVVVRDRINHSFDQNPSFCVLDVEQGKYDTVASPDFNPENAALSDSTWGLPSPFGCDGQYLYCLACKVNDIHLVRIDIHGNIETVCDFPGAICGFDIASTGKIYAVAQYGMVLNELYLLGKAPQRLTGLNDTILADKTIAKPVHMTTRYKEYTIDGFVMPPVGFDPAKTYPAVLEIHGGPKNIYSPVYYHELQLLAAQGYFVIFCNPVGSDGKGSEFFEAIRARYGTLDYESLMAFYEAALINWPQIDPERVAVTGGSYGGFLTNWIIGHTNRFACAASQRSISNMISFWGNADVGFTSVTDKNGGDIYHALELLWEQSPLKYASDVTTPTLFLHSDEDYRCPLEQGVQMYTAVTLTGTDTRLVVFKGENHSLSRSGKPQNRIRRLEEMLNWFERYTSAK